MTENPSTFPLLTSQIQKENVPKTHFSIKQYRTESVPTHVFLVVDYGVVVYFAVAVPVHGFYMICIISCMDGSLKLTLKH